MPRGDDLAQEIENDTESFSSPRSEAFKRVVEAYAADGDLLKASQAKIEWLIFAFRETESFGSGGYFGPRYTRSDGTPFPDFYSLPPNTQEYLKSRLASTGNPLHKARYADFLWDKFRDKESGTAAVRAYIECANLAVGRGDGNAGYRAVRRACHLAQQFEDWDLKNAAKTAVLDLVHRLLSSHDLSYLPRVADALLRVSDILAPEELVEMVGRMEIVRAHYVNARDYYQERNTLKVLRQLHRLNGDEDAERKAWLAEGESFEAEGDYKLEQKGLGGGPEPASSLYQLALTHFLDMGETARVEVVQRKLKTGRGRR